MGTFERGMGLIPYVHFAGGAVHPVSIAAIHEAITAATAVHVSNRAIR